MEPVLPSAARAGLQGGHVGRAPRPAASRSRSSSARSVIGFGFRRAVIRARRPPSGAADRKRSGGPRSRRREGLERLRDEGASVATQAVQLALASSARRDPLSRSTGRECRGSGIAMSARTLRSTSIPAWSRPWINRAVGQALLARRGVDALDPQRAEVALTVLAVAVGVLLGLVHRRLGGADGVLAAAVEALGRLRTFLCLAWAVTPL